MVPAGLVLALLVRSNTTEADRGSSSASCSAMFGGVWMCPSQTLARGQIGLRRAVHLHAIPVAIERGVRGQSVAATARHAWRALARGGLTSNWAWRGGDWGWRGLRRETFVLRRAWRVLRRATFVPRQGWRAVRHAWRGVIWCNFGSGCVPRALGQWGWGVGWGWGYSPFDD